MADEWNGPEIPLRPSPRDAQRRAAAAAGTRMRWWPRVLIGAAAVGAVVSLAAMVHAHDVGTSPEPAPAVRVDVRFEGMTEPAMVAACDAMAGELIYDPNVAPATWTCEGANQP